METIIQVFFLIVVLVVGYVIALNVAARNRQEEALKKAASASDAFGDAHFARLEEIEPFGLFSKDGMTLGGGFVNDDVARWLTYKGEQHLVTISAPRTGKFTSALAPALLTYPASAIVVDPKGQAAAVTGTQRQRMGHKVYYINPFELHGLPDSGFNPLALLDPQSDTFVADVAALVDALILPSGGDTHWTDGASALLEALIMWVCLTADNPTLPKVREILCKPYAEFTELAKIISEDKFFPMAQKAARYASDEFRDNQGMISTALTQIALLGEPRAAASLSRHSFDWAALKTGQVTVYLILPAQYIRSHSRWFRLLIVSAIYRLSTPEKGSRPVLFILDEFTQLGKLNAVFDALNLSAGYGIQFWLVFQSLALLEEVYGRGYEAILATAGITQLFRVNDSMTAEYFSNRAGKYTRKLTSHSVGEISREQAYKGYTGVSSSYSETAVPLLSPQNLYGWPSQMGLLFVNGLEYPIAYYLKPYHLDEGLRALADPDPYHRANPAPPPADEKPAPAEPQPVAAKASTTSKRQGMGGLISPETRRKLADAMAAATSKAKKWIGKTKTRLEETKRQGDPWQ